MSAQEQESLKSKYYNEALRYMSNAKNHLAQAPMEDNFYSDEKHVKAACRMAYKGVLKALDGMLAIKGMERPKTDDMYFYLQNLDVFSRKTHNMLKSAYEILLVAGCYDGTNNVAVVKSGFDEAYAIIEKIKPKTVVN